MRTRQFIQRLHRERMALVGDLSMNAIALNISKKTHALLEPNLHDGTLVSIGLPRKGNADLIVAELSGKRYRFVLDGVFHLLATDFREGNIILDVTVSQGENVQLGDLESLVHVGPDGQRPQKYVRAIYDRVLGESLYVLELIPSYGCYLIAVAKNISIFREDDVAV
jgi:hypothetical protein